MFIIYHSNDLDVQKDLLLEILAKPLEDPFDSEVILVQSPGMAQWLQWKIAEAKGVVSNIKFPMPASFIWQMYAANLPNVEAQNPFNKTSMTWRLMRLIPHYLALPEFAALQHYFSKAAATDQQKGEQKCEQKYEQKDEQKLYQLAYKIADLFDQYLVYRPEWIKYWEVNQDKDVLKSITSLQDKLTQQQLLTDVTWQGILWRALVSDIQQQYQGEQPLHRVNLQQQFLQLLATERAINLPKRIFIFGISALPIGYLETLQAMSQYCEVHLFFTNMCKAYWGDLIDEKFLAQLRLQQREFIDLKKQQNLNCSLEKKYVVSAQQKHFETTAEQEWCFSGHPLLSSWGKLGRDFLYLLTQLEQQEKVYGIEAYVDSHRETLLAQVQSKILNLDGSRHLDIPIAEDKSLTFHSCHSQMREVEVLQDYLLHLFQENPDLTPKDVVVMSADIDSYTPYIQAVFGQKSRHNPTIPFSITDNKLSENDLLIASFLHLLNLKNHQFSAEALLALLDIPAIRDKFQISLNDLPQARNWVEKAGIRFGLAKDQEGQTNYNAWQAGLENMLLGHAMREENGIWQESLGFDSSYGLQGQLVGKLCEFVEVLAHWQQKLYAQQSIAQWQQDLCCLLDDMFLANEHNFVILNHLQQSIAQTLAEIQESQFDQQIGIDVLAEVLAAALQDDPNGMRFLVGKVNFCTLLPMRSIPFKVVCLLGMNDGEYPRQHTPNSFDLMQYDRRKGDRFRRDDDCYLFLEALLSAQDYFYVSFIGRSIVDNSPKEPSVLVSQLLDYLGDCLEQGSESNWREKLVQQHTMSAFNPANFSCEPRSFAHHWLPLAQVEKATGASNFMQTLDCSLTEEDRNISLSDLVHFVQNPVAFFFKRRLGMYFSVQDEDIPESENFELDNLTSYLIKNELLYTDSSQDQAVFEKLKIKGVMPRGAFSTIYQQKQQQSIVSLRETVRPYLSQTAQLQSVALEFSTSQGKVKLEGNLSNLYEQKMIYWRSGAVKDKHIIELWIRYLVQCAMSEDEVAPPIFYGSDSHITFSPLQANGSVNVQQQALVQLHIYIESYLLGYRQLVLIPTQNIEKYAKNVMEQGALNHNRLESFLQQSAFGESYTMNGDSYWQRVLLQQSLDDTFLENIHQQWKKWFELLLAHLSKIKA